MKVKKNHLMRDLRLSNELTIHEMAEILDVSTAAVIKCEASATVSPAMKVKLLKKFNLDDDFFEYLAKKKALAKFEALEADEVADEV